MGLLSKLSILIFDVGEYLIKVSGIKRVGIMMRLGRVAIVFCMGQLSAFLFSVLGPYLIYLCAGLRCAIDCHGDREMLFSCGSSWNRNEH